MITRSQMRRQLRAQGGIMNVAPREKFGLGSKIKERIRKLIPNEIASVATKAAPFVAPFNPAIAGIMRGVGRFDQRGSISDALKQGIGTYAGGQAARMLGGGETQLGFRGADKKLFTSPLNAERTEAVKGLFKKQELTNAKNAKNAESIKNTPGIIQTGVEKTIDKVPLLRDLPPMVKQKLLVGGITGGASALYSYYTGEFEPQQPGETMGEYLARREERVKTQMRGFMDSYYTPLRNAAYANMSDKDKNNYIDSLVGQTSLEGTTDYQGEELASGGRVGLANGNLVDPRMQNSLQENIRRNNAARAVNQMSRSFDFSNLFSQYGINPKRYDSTPGPMRGIPAVKGMRDRIIQDIMSTQQPYSLTPQKPPEPRDSLTGMPESMMLPNMADGSMRSLAEEDAIRDKVLAAQQENKPSYQERLMGESWETLSDNDQYRIAQEYPGETPPRRNPSFVPNMNQGGRVGLMGGSMPMGEPRVNQGGITELDYRAKGGFVPVGIKEKADDVPAMLSKNEFVFTADAVRGAGNGSIENGAQKMYDTMKNLERRVT